MGEKKIVFWDIDGLLQSHSRSLLRMCLKLKELEIPRDTCEVEEGSGRWEKSLLFGILNNPAYAGSGVE